jgi:hypothetical protein
MRAPLYGAALMLLWMGVPLVISLPRFMNQGGIETAVPAVEAFLMVVGAGAFAGIVYSVLAKPLRSLFPDQIAANVTGLACALGYLLLLTFALPVVGLDWRGKLSPGEALLVGGGLVVGFGLLLGHMFAKTWSLLDRMLRGT